MKTMWGEKPYHSYDYELRKRYGEKIYKVSLNGGMTCPNRTAPLAAGLDSCSAGGSGDFAGNPRVSITTQIEEQKALVASKFPAKRSIAYFQAYTNTYAPLERLEALFTEATATGHCRSFHRHPSGLPAPGNSFPALQAQPGKTGFCGTGAADHPRFHSRFYPPGL